MFVSNMLLSFEFILRFDKSDPVSKHLDGL